MDNQKPTTRLFLVRHGETAENLRMTYLGKTNEPLTEHGMLQAQKVADALSQLPIDLVVSSPLKRAADTAATISEACRVDLRLDPRLAEGSFGTWEGLTRDEVLKLGPWDAALLERWESDASCSPPGGESLESVQHRVVLLANDLARTDPGISIVLVSHVGPIKALLAAVLDIPLQASRSFFLDPATISVVEWGPHPLLRLFNSHAHMGWSKARWMK